MLSMLFFSDDFALFILYFYAAASRQRRLHSPLHFFTLFSPFFDIFMI